MTKVAHACGNEFCEKFVDEGDCEARPRAEVDFFDGSKEYFWCGDVHACMKVTCQFLSCLGILDYSNGLLLAG